MTTTSAKEPTVIITVEEYKKMVAAVAKLEEIRKAAETRKRRFDEGRWDEYDEARYAIDDLLNGLCE